MTGTNPNSRRNNSVPIYMSPELRQSIRNLSGWFSCSFNEMMNRLLRLGLLNSEFLIEADKKKAEYKHQRAVEFLNCDFNKQKETQNKQSKQITK
jgi:hypothetical protein